MITRTTCAFLLTLASSACTEAPKAAPPAPPVPETLAPLALDPALARLPLGERLQREANARPSRAVHAEQISAALAGRGVSTAKRHQVLASPLGAAYCELSLTGEGLGLSVCEFDDPAQAQTGALRSRQLFDALVPGRTLRTQGSTLLTVTRPESSAAAREAELILRVFEEQHPTELRAETALVR